MDTFPLARARSGTHLFTPRNTVAPRGPVERAMARATGYALADAVRDFLAFSRVTKGNAPRWVDFKAGTLQEFTRYVLGHGVRSLEALQPWHLSEYLEHRQRNAGDAPATLTRRAITIRAMARWAEDQGRVKAAPLARVRAPRQVRAQREIPPRAAVLALIARIPDEDIRAAAELLILTGMRRSELLALRWCDLDLMEGLAFLRCTNAWRPKNARPRAVPLTERACAILRERKDLGGAGPFQRDGKTIPHKDTLTKAWRRIADAAGLSGHRLHDLRHEFCTHAINDLGQDVLTVQAVAGHADIETTRLYAHPNADSALRMKHRMDAEEQAQEGPQAGPFKTNQRE